LPLGFRLSAFGFELSALFLAYGFELLAFAFGFELSACSLQVPYTIHHFFHLSLFQ
jgi:hypothetical protein